MGNLPLVPDPNYRFNVDRGIFVSGLMDQQLLDRLTPQIMRLTSSSRGPVSVFIDSPGGYPPIGESILRLLRARNQDYDPPCRIITVVTTLAASAAADLLSCGDYSVGLTGSRVYFHGTRQSRSDPLTVEKVSGLIEDLRSDNDRYAVELAHRCQGRFFHRFVTFRAEFPAERERQANPNLSDLECLIAILLTKISAPAAKVVRLAVKKNRRYSALQATVFKSPRVRKPLSPKKRWADTEAEVLKRIIGFELKTNKDPSWTFRHAGFRTLSDDFLLFDEYLGHHSTDRIKAVFDLWGQFLLDQKDLEEIAVAPEEAQSNLKVEKLRPVMMPLWLFFVALCHALQEGENDLSAADAFWLGLIDEILEEPGAYSIRLMAEYRHQELSGI